MATKIDSKTARDKLAPQREPYWHKIRVGLHLGYRKTEYGEGTWIARRTEGTKKTYQALGQFLDAGQPKRTAFDSAIAAANAWSGNVDAGVEVHGTDLETACKAYVTRQHSEKGKANADDAEGRFRRLVYGKAFGRIRLDKLTTIKVRAWRDAQLPKDVDEEAERRAKDSINRNLATLKAALNMALADRLVSTDAGWKTVTKFEKVGRRRELFLSRDQRVELLAACPADLRELVQGLMLTALRPGELAAADACDFDKTHGTLNIRKSKTEARIVPLSTSAAKFFSELTRNRIGAHPLVVDAFGARWDKDKWKKPFKAASKMAKLPVGAVVYSLRHAAISELLIGGMDVHAVAKVAGTSTDMIDKHYGHLCIERTRKQLDTANLG
jgi:integrase